MTLHTALYSVCYRTSMMLNLETCFIAKAVGDKNWTIITGHGILDASHVCTINPAPIHSDRQFREIRKPSSLQFKDTFKTQINFEYLAHQGHDFLLFCASRIQQPPMTLRETEFYNTQYRLVHKMLAEFKPWPTSLGPSRH